jgi:hypothetical protein
VANNILWSATVTIATALSTELNALANAASAVSSAIDNTSGRHMYSDWELAVAYGSAPAANGRCTLYLLPSVDGTNYPDFVSGSEPPHMQVGGFPLRAVTSAQRLVLRRVLVPPGLFKVGLLNSAGQAMPATGTTVKYIFYDEQVQ